MSKIALKGNELDVTEKERHARSMKLEKTVPASAAARSNKMANRPLEPPNKSTQARRKMPR